MPIRFQSISDDFGNPNILASILGPIFDRTNSAFVTPDKQHFIGRSDMIDCKTGNVIGQYVFTIFSNLEAQRNEILDVDIILMNSVPTELHFLQLLSGSSDANEYYEVETVDTQQHLEIETVNRYTVTDKIIDTIRPAYLSIFPFELTLYKDINELNRKFGFKKKHSIGQTSLTVAGLSDTFCAPGRMFSSDDTQQRFSLLLGTVENCQDVSVNIGQLRYDFVLAQVKTALGTVPVAMGRNVFDLRKLRVGRVIAMRAYVKADLSKPEDWLR